MFIPPQLRRPEFRFCKVRGKRPYEPAWQERNNYRYDDQSLHDSFSNDQGYGVIGGYGGLLVVDGDSHEIIEDVFPRLPKTFSVLTGSGKLHCYYIIDDCTSFKATGQDGQTLVDFQGRGKQVIGPGSVYPGSDRRYTVLDDLPIASITRKDLIRHFADFLSLDNVIPPKPIQRHTTGENAATAIKTALPLSRVLAGEGVNIQRGNTACLWHPSQRGKCLVFDDAKGLWYCFHCAQGGDVITFIQIHRRLDFIGACRYLTDTYGLRINLDSDDYGRKSFERWLRRRKDGQNGRIPSSALNYVAKTHNIVPQDHQGMLSPDQYRAVLQIVEWGY